MVIEKVCYEVSKFTNLNSALPKGYIGLPVGRNRTEIG